MPKQEDGYCIVCTPDRYIEISLINGEAHSTESFRFGTENMVRGIWKGRLLVAELDVIRIRQFIQASEKVGWSNIVSQEKESI